MIKLHCWNDYDPLKTVILGSVFDNDKIPNRYEGQDQENFIKIVEESNTELNNFQKILEQNNVRVLRPKQPELYNNENLTFHEPLINMRDFFIVYGNIFFTTYGPYRERRFQHFWIDDIILELIKSNNLIVNSPEINLSESEINFSGFISDKEFFQITNFNIPYLPRNIKQAKILYDKQDKIFSENSLEWDWFKKHNLVYKNKILFHTAYVLKKNKKAYIASYGELSNGHKWFENWLNFLGVEPVYVPFVGHLDGSVIFLNENTILLDQARTDLYNKSFVKYFDNINDVINISRPKIFHKLPQSYFNECLQPTTWNTKWKKLINKNPINVNSLVINPNKILLSFYDKEIYNKLKNKGIETIYIKWSNAPFWEGNIHCITCELERRPE